MYLPDLTPSNQLAVEALHKAKPADDDPVKQFQHYARNFDFRLSLTPKFSAPLYPDFADYDYQHDTSRLTQVYLNDYDFHLEDHREELRRLTQMNFETNTFDSIARCGCPPNSGGLEGNYLLDSGRVCKKCGEEVEQFLNKGEDTNMWIRPPEGVKQFVNIGFFSTFFNNITIGNPSPKVCVARFFMDSTYHKAELKKKNGSMIALLNMLTDLDIPLSEVNINTFIDRCDDLMKYLLLGPGRRYTKYTNNGGPFYQMYLKYRHLVFPKYMKVPARYCSVFERSGKEAWTYSHQPETAQIYYTIADCKKSTLSRKLNDKELRRNAEVVGKSLVTLADQYRTVNNPKAIFNKPAISRKHMGAASVPFTGRTVVTSQTGIIDADVLICPWKMMIDMLRPFIKSYLYRIGFTPRKANTLLNQAAYAVVPEIDAFFSDMEENRKCLIQTGRNPTIEYLSIGTYNLKVNRDLEDESIKIPITGVKPYNCDFDGDQMYITVIFDNESKAKAYGGWTHHQTLDKHKPFTVSGYAGQAATNLMNLNTLMMQEVVTSI